jgi:hypothetical protein
MKELYSETDLFTLEKGWKRYLFLALLALALALASSLLLLLVLTHSNKGWLFLLQTFLFSLGFSFALVAYLGRAIPIRHHEELVDAALHNPRVICQGKIKKVGKTVTVSSGLEAAEIEMETADGGKIFYWDVLLGEPAFSLGEIVQFQVADNWIVGIEAFHG